jgi:hypothetical protein
MPWAQSCSHYASRGPNLSKPYVACTFEFLILKTPCLQVYYITISLGRLAGKTLTRTLTAPIYTLEPKTHSRLRHAKTWQIRKKHYYIYKTFKRKSDSCRIFCWHHHPSLTCTVSFQRSLTRSTSALTKSCDSFDRNMLSASSRTPHRLLVGLPIALLKRVFRMGKNVFLRMDAVPAPENQYL